TCAGVAFLAACSDSAAPPVLTTLTVTLGTANIIPGQTSTVTASGKDQRDVDFAAGTITWSSSATSVPTVHDTGVVTGVTAGTAVITATVGTVTGQQTITVKASPDIRINEVESNGGTPGDWIELYNATTAPVDISGWGVRDNDSTHTIYKIPAGTTIAAGGFYVVEEAQFGFGLGAPDEARLYNQFGALVEL